MNRIISPFEYRMRSAEVANLQGALHFLLDRAAILTNYEASRRALSEDLQRGRAENIYEVATREIVRIVQEERRLEAHGRVQEPTGDALHAMRLLLTVAARHSDRPAALARLGRSGLRTLISTTDLCGIAAGPRLLSSQGD